MLKPLNIYVLFILIFCFKPAFALLPEMSLPQNQKIKFTDQEKEYLKNKKEIKMCIDPDWMPFEAINKGIHTGMTADYFKIFEKNIGIPIKIIPTKTWSESLEMGRQKKCDIFSLIMVTPDRKNYLDFTKPYFKTPLVIATQLSQPWISDLSNVSNKKIGIVKDYAYGEILRLEYPNLDLITVNSVTEGLGRVNKGEIFGFVGTHASVGYHIQEKYFGEIKISGNFQKFWTLGIGTRNDEPHLKSIFNKVISSISAEEHRNIHNKWVVVNIDDISSNKLTTNEKNFIKKHPVIRFKIRPERPPFEFSHKGEASGIAVDYITSIAEITGFKAEFVVSNIPLNQSYEIVQNSRKEFDTLAYSVKSSERAKKFAYGVPYLTYPMMIIGHKESPYIGKTSDLKSKKVAIEKSFLTIDWLKRDYPEINIIETENTKAALEMVNNKKADAYVGNIAVANYMMTHENMHNLKLLAPSDYGTINYRFIAPKKWPELASILSKGYASLPQSFHSTTQQKWFSVQIVENINYDLLWKITAGIAFIIMWILWWSRKLFIQKQKTEKALCQLQEAQLLLKKQNDELERLSVTDSLTSLNNRLKLDSVISKEFERSKRYGNKFGVIMTDIDHFKRVNDTFGHQTGDQVLISFAELIKTNVRKVDVVGRWGGEEFLIICPETDKTGLIQVAENLRKLISSHKFKSVGHVTASFGASLFHDDRSIEVLISRVDEALYLSKENGRDRITFK